MCFGGDLVESDVDLLFEEDVLVLFAFLLVGPLVSLLHKGHLEFIRRGSFEIIVADIGLAILFRRVGFWVGLILLEVGALLDALHLVIGGLARLATRGLLLLDVLEELLALLHL